MPQREIKTYHGAKNAWVPNEFGELKYNPSMGYSGEGYQVFGKGFYQALDPNTALSNYAIPLSEDAGTKGALLENITNPDLYYDFNKPLSKQSRFIKNALVNELNNPEINEQTIKNIIKNRSGYGRSYDVSNLTDDDYISEILRWQAKGTSYEKGKELYDIIKRHPEHLEAYRPFDKNYYFDKAYRELYRSGALDNIPVGNTSTNMINQRMDELILNDILKANNGEIPMELLRKNSPLADALNKISPSESEYDTIIKAITKHGGAGITRTGNTDGKIYISGNPNLVSSKNINASNMEPIAEMIAKGELPKPTINKSKPNLKVEPIIQTNVKPLSTPARNINKQTPKPQVQVKQPTITPKQVDVPLGARLYEAGLNPTKVAKVLSDPKLLSQASKTLGQIVSNPKTYINLAKGVFTPENIAIVGSDYLMHKADQAVENRLKAKYNVKSQTEFNKLYPTLSTIERGQLGNTYPEMYQMYMKGR